jgi:signal transduction histidine kinase
MFNGSLRTKLVLSLVGISAALTAATLMLVRGRVEIRAREEISSGLESSLITFQQLQQQREMTLKRSATLVAALPPVKAVMTSHDRVTIQDASAMFWKMIGSQLLVLSDGSAKVMALHCSNPGFTETEAQEALSRSAAKGESRSWWFGGGRIFEVSIQPIYFGAPEEHAPIGLVVVGYEIDDQVASDIGRVARGEVAFSYGRQVAASTLGSKSSLVAGLARKPGSAQEIHVDGERFLASSIRLSAADSQAVTLTVLKSFAETAAFLGSLNRWIVGIGVAAVLAGSLLMFLVSTTFTRPLAELAGGVKALEKGDFAYPLRPRGNDEVSALTTAFQDMRQRLEETQKQLVDSERLATIGRMANTISHDLRHPLTAILAYAEFLSEGRLSEAQRKDFFQEIRIAVNRMTDEINSLLGFAKQREVIRPAFGHIEEVVERAIQTVKALPEFGSIEVSSEHSGDGAAWFDPGKTERVILNLLFNACEAVDPRSGRVTIATSVSESGLQIRVSDNGPGIPQVILASLFQPFVSFGKEKGTGLGLTVVQKIMRDHGGQVTLEKTGPEGTVFRLNFPAAVEAEKLQAS